MWVPALLFEPWAPHLPGHEEEDQVCAFLKKRLIPSLVLKSAAVSMIYFVRLDKVGVGQ